MNKEEVLDEINVLYERISNPEDCENGCYSFSDGNYTEALEILIDYYEVGLIEELEKIIAKIDFEEKWLLDVYAKEYRVSANDIKIAMSGIRSVVSGLKEDNKQSRCNNCQNNTDELSGECYECVKGIEDWYEPISEPKGEAE